MLSKIWYGQARGRGVSDLWEHVRSGAGPLAPLDERRPAGAAGEEQLPVRHAAEQRATAHVVRKQQQGDADEEERRKDE